MHRAVLARGRLRSLAHIPAQRAAQRGAVQLEPGKILADARAFQTHMLDVPELFDLLVHVVARQKIFELADRDKDVLRLDELPFPAVASIDAICHAMSTAGQGFAIRVS